MGVYLDIKMPRNCTECPCLKLGEYLAFEKSSCWFNHLINIRMRGRPKDCPLVPATKEDVKVIEKGE